MILSTRVYYELFVRGISTADIESPITSTKYTISVTYYLKAITTLDMKMRDRNDRCVMRNGNHFVSAKRGNTIFRWHLDKLGEYRRRERQKDEMCVSFMMRRRRATNCYTPVRCSAPSCNPTWKESWVHVERNEGDIHITWLELETRGSINGK